MAKYRLGCCIPGASFMPEGVSGVSPAPYDVLRRGTDVILSHGFDYAEAGVGMIMKLSDAELAAAVNSRIEIEACNSFIPFEYKIVRDGSSDVGSPLYEYVRRALERLSALGIKIVVFGSGGARRIPDGMSIADGRTYILRFLSMCAALSAEYDLSIAIEPLRALECNAINYLDDAISLVVAANDSHITYLADAFHMCHGGEPADALTRVSIMPSHIHIAEAPDRTCPGSRGGEYLTAFAQALHRTPYAARVSVECGFEDFDRECGLAYDFASRLY